MQRRCTLRVELEYVTGNAETPYHMGDASFERNLGYLNALDRHRETAVNSPRW